ASEGSAVLERELRYAGLLNRSPTTADLAAVAESAANLPSANGTDRPWTPDPSLPDFGLLAAFPNLVLFDGRVTNIATERVRGYDVSLRASPEVTLGRLDFAVNATYTPTHERNVTPESPAFARLNEPGYPVDFRVHATAGLTHFAWGGYFSVNHYKGYPNPFS